LPSVANAVPGGAVQRAAQPDAVRPQQGPPLGGDQGTTRLRVCCCCRTHAAAHPPDMGPALRADCNSGGARWRCVSGFIPSCYPLARMSSSISRALLVPLNPKPLNPKPLRNHNLFLCGRAEWAHPRRMRANRGHARCLRVSGQRASLSMSTSVLERARLDLLLPPRASRILCDGAGAHHASSSSKRRQRCQHRDLV
jgi:hypothetical protein